MTIQIVVMATIPPKTWSWRGNYSGQNILFFQVIKIKLAVNEGTLETFYEVKLERSHPNSLCILFIGNKGH
jgi:hypothetical protein